MCVAQWSMVWEGLSSGHFISCSYCLSVSLSLCLSVSLSLCLSLKVTNYCT